MPREKPRYYEFAQEPESLEKGRAVVSLAFAFRACSSLPMASEWALKVIGLETLPRDLRLAARYIAAPNYLRAGQLCLTVPEHELINPLITGMRLIMEPHRKTASIAEHNRICGLLAYTLPVIEREMNEQTSTFDQVCRYYEFQ